MQRARSRRSLALSFSLSSVSLSLLLLALASEPARAQTDVGLSFYGAFNSSAAYNGGLEHQTPANSAGGLIELRHITNPLVGYELTYSYNRANQVYSYMGPTPAGVQGPFVNTISNNAHEITGDWLFSAPLGKLRPFALVGIGVLLNEPVAGQMQTTNSNKPVYVYGVGVDWNVIPHFGLRFQFRGNVYKAPDISTAFGSDSAFMHTSEPMIGAYFKF